MVDAHVDRLCDGKGMIDIRLTRLTGLSFVSFFRKIVSADDLGDLLWSSTREGLRQRCLWLTCRFIKTTGLNKSTLLVRLQRRNG